MPEKTHFEYAEAVKKAATLEDIAEIFERLFGDDMAADEPTGGILEAFIAGKYTNATPLVFWDRLQEAAAANKGVIAPLVMPFDWFMSRQESRV